MPSSGVAVCDWKDRAATRLSNGKMTLTALSGGGHIADLRLERQAGATENLLWEAPWPTADPCQPGYVKLARKYGPVEVGRFLAGYTGHALCLNYFGAPSEKQSAAGLGLHGEAAPQMWRPAPHADEARPSCRWSVDLPAAGLRFERSIRLGDGETIAYLEESVHNQRPTEQAIHWVQHAAFGPPFLKPDHCTITASAERGMVSADEYSGRNLLASRQGFLWPIAPRNGGGASVDLRRPFSQHGRGLLACARLDPQQSLQSVVVSNWKRRLAVGYCFRRQDFPWMAIWEENCARANAPWNGEAQVRGMEFGTTPLPLTPDDAFPGDSIFGMPGWRVLPPHATATARYILFVAELPPDIETIESVGIRGDFVHLPPAARGRGVALPAAGCEMFLSAIA